MTRQCSAIYKFSIEISLSSKGQNKSKLQKQISNILISTVTQQKRVYERKNIRIVDISLETFRSRTLTLYVGRVVVKE